MNIETHQAMLRRNGTLVARILVGVLFLLAGFMKLTGGVAGEEGFQAAIAGMGLPLPIVIAWIVVAVEIIGGAALIVGFHFYRAAFVLLAFIVLTLIFVHNSMEDPMMLKNAAIAGGLLYMLAYGPGDGWSIDRRGRKQVPSM